LLLLAAAAVAGLAAPLTRRRRLLRLALFGVLYLVTDVGLVISCAILWLRHPIAERRDQASWSRSHQKLLSRVLSVLVGSAGPLLGFAVEVQEPPDQELIAGCPLLVLARHGGPGDSVALVHLLMSRYQRRPAIVLREELQWDPGLDVILGRLPCCFIRQGDGAAMASTLTELARDLDSDDAILLFPEGGNWTPVRHRRAIVRLSRAGRCREQPERAAAAAIRRSCLPGRAAGPGCCDRRPHGPRRPGKPGRCLASPAGGWPADDRQVVVRARRDGPRRR
jgi:hypothetical protein